jgi:hypothetical protein
MIKTITTATPRITNCWVFFGSKPAGFADLFSIVPRICAVLAASCSCSVFSVMGNSESFLANLTATFNGE